MLSCFFSFSFLFVCFFIISLDLYFIFLKHPWFCNIFFLTKKLSYMYLLLISNGYSIFALFYKSDTLCMYICIMWVVRGGREGGSTMNQTTQGSMILYFYWYSFLFLFFAAFKMMYILTLDLKCNYPILFSTVFTVCTFIIRWTFSVWVYVSLSILSFHL